MSEQPTLEACSTPPAEQVASRYSSLFTRQAAFVTVMILLTGGGLTVAGYGFARATITDQIRKRLTAEAIERQTSLLAYVGRQQERTQLLSHHSRLLELLDGHGEGLISDEELQQGGRDTLEEFLHATTPASTDLARDGGRYLAIKLIDSEANAVLEVGDSINPGPFEGILEYELGRSQFVLGPPAVSDDTYRVFIAAPVVTPAQRQYVAMIEADAQPLMFLLTDTNAVGETGEIVVGRVINDTLQLMNPHQDQQLKDRRVGQLSYLAAALTGNMEYGAGIDRRGRDILVASLPLDFDRWALAAKIDKDEAYEPLGNLRLVLFGLAAGTLFFGVLLSYVFTFRMTRPLMQLVRFSSNVARGEFQQRCPIDSQDEIGILARSLNHMAAELQQSYATLEQRVERRASQLITANKKLTQEAEIRQVTEEALEQERFLLQTLLETLPDNIYFKDRGQPLHPHRPSHGAAVRADRSRRRQSARQIRFLHRTAREPGSRR